MRHLRWVFVLIFVVLMSIPTVAQDDNSSGTHVVQSGENLFRIALRYGVDMNELAALNNIYDVTTVYVGQVLTIPGLEPVDASEDIANPLVAATPVTHIVQRGEFLGRIADSYNVSIEDILTANNLTNANAIYAGQELQIWTSDISVAVEEVPETDLAIEAAVEASEAAVEDVVHIVAPGEYLSQIGQRYGVPWTAIAEANSLTNTNNITAGTALVIPGADASVNNGNVVSSVSTIAQNLPDPGAHWGYGREIVVDISSQMTYAYEDGNLVFSALVSTGLPATPTVQGEYAIWHKTPGQTMSGPGYYLPNVQWVMYFYQGYGFHGTYWHNNFGNPMSHGCVNMTNEDAQWLFNFGSIGTNVWVQY